LRVDDAVSDKDGFRLKIYRIALPVRAAHKLFLPLKVDLSPTFLESQPRFGQSLHTYHRNGLKVRPLFSRRSSSHRGKLGSDVFFSELTAASSNPATL
jgi:hypothetical protein